MLDLTTLETLDELLWIGFVAVAFFGGIIAGMHR